MKKNSMFLSLLVITGLVLTSCMSYVQVKGNVKVKGGTTIAVVAGTTSAANVQLAEVFGEQIKMHTTLQVVKAAGRLRPYPQKIQGPYPPVFEKLEADYSLSDKKKIAEILKKVNTDILLVVWSPAPRKEVFLSRVEGHRTTHRVSRDILPCVGQFFQRGTMKELAVVKMDITVYDKKSTEGALNIGGGKLPTTKYEAMIIDTRKAAKELGKKLGVARK